MRRTIAPMPLYEYRCRTCDERFDLRRSMADADAPARCAAGHDDAVRLLAAFASTGKASSSGGASPMPSMPSGGGGCGTGCGCAH
jgi:putative FmdB family regulatory protein